ncbi:histidinol-phosphate transaminase [Gulosibacter sp. 10]|uniref:histidinol-phosphate transaminase n=1 Tax=Gulosibacter sp. 10 TaxID=1255570 RepID=UPI00097E93CC|nr:histidinol-phosphate transaminase [Gulosibacter sp. 10]SJM70392.1 Histidinol-phosphate aminotransferase [Gulosibacter sp. 10]
MTSLDDLPLRDDLRGKRPYGAPQEEVRVSINVNENPYPVPEAVATNVIQKIARSLPGLNRYPDREFSELRERLAAYLGGGIVSEQVWAANGSNEVLQQLLQVFAGPGRTVMGFGPTYSMYSLLAQGVGSEWIAAERDEDFELSPESARRAVLAHRPDVLLLCSPNNPTGTPLSLETIRAAYEAADGLVVVDEAYGEFRPDGMPSALELLPGRPRLVVSRTMSKAFAYAGARLGYFAADPVIADAVRLVRLPYHLSAITQAAACGALEFSDVMLSQVDLIRAQRDRLVTEIAALGYRVYRSAANFVMFGGVADPAAMFQEFYRRSILIRDNGIPGCLRVTAGTESETTLFLEALAEITRERPELKA